MTRRVPRHLLDVAAAARTPRDVQRAATAILAVLPVDDAGVIARRCAVLVAAADAVHGRPPRSSTVRAREEA